MGKTNYWGFRIDWRNREAAEFLIAEINEGRLRQGWGWDEKQKLPHPTLNEGEKANIPIYEKVKKGDYLLIPHVPSYEKVTIVKASQDFNSGYKYEIAERKAEGEKKGFKDYGHIFPIEKPVVCSFNRNNVNVNADLKTTLRTPMRFWNIGNEEAIKKILSLDSAVLEGSSKDEQRAADLLEEAISSTLDEDKLRDRLKLLFEQSFQAAEWEFALRKVLELTMPHCFVKRVGGISEAKHGCDLAVFIPSIEKEKKYVIGIQIKDYRNQVSTTVLDQINKAEYWTEDKKNNCILIDKYVIVIDSTKYKNAKLEEEAKKNKIRVLYREDVLDLLSRAAKIQMANNL